MHTYALFLAAYTLLAKVFLKKISIKRLLESNSNIECECSITNLPRRLRVGVQLIDSCSVVTDK